MGANTVKQLEQAATDVQIPEYKRDCDAGILLMTYENIRLADVQRLRPFATNGDSSSGALICSKTKKPRGQNWPWPCPVGASLAQEDGRNLCWTCGLLAPGLTGAKWRTPPPGPTYSTTRTKLALLCLGLGDEKGGACTLHSPKNPLQAAANHMRFGQREMAIVGRWPSTSRMPEKYDRGSARASCSYATLSCRKSPMCGA